MGINAMTQEGIRSKATLDEAWRNKHRAQLVIGFRQEEPGDYEIYARAVDAAGNRAESQRIHIEIVP